LLSAQRAPQVEHHRRQVPPDHDMLEITPQERTALIVLAVLLTSGAVARHAIYRADSRDRLQYTPMAADTLNAGSASALLQRVEAAVERERTRRAPLGPGERIDPNRATADELARLPRVGPALAERIVAHRQSVGPFRSQEDLRAVPGIGPAVLEGIGPHLDLARAPPAGARDSRQRNGIDFNRASAEELQSIPGIGPVIAERIVEHRNANGRFRTFADLEEVSGIGPRLRERLERAGRLGP
jgi:competence ComEA-like helix-hairpin-helix protein